MEKIPPLAIETNPLLGFQLFVATRVKPVNVIVTKSLLGMKGDDDKSKVKVMLLLEREPIITAPPTVTGSTLPAKGIPLENKISRVPAGGIEPAFDRKEITATVQGF